jgi:hypothetical protein
MSDDVEVADVETPEVEAADEWTPPSKEDVEALTSELNRLKRVSSEAAKKAKESEKAAKAAADEQAKKDGNWQTLAEEREREAAEALKDAETARLELQKYKAQATVASAAATLNFRDPQDALRFLTEEEAADQKLAEAALKRLKKDKPYLIAEPRRSGADQSGDGMNDPALTPEQQHSKWISQLL